MSLLAGLPAWVSRPRLHFLVMPRLFLPLSLLALLALLVPAAAAPAAVSPALAARASAEPAAFLDLLVTVSGDPAVLPSPARAARLLARRRQVDDLAAEHAGRGLLVVQRYSELPVVRVSLPGSGLAALAADPRVLSVRENGVKRALDAEGNALMHVPEVRDLGWDGAGITVAVVDTGVDSNHPELAGRVVKLYDAIDHDGDPQDGYGHGTGVAGIVAGAQYGVARAARVAAVRVLDNRGNGTDADVLEGMDAVLASVLAGNPYSIKVLNMSLGGYVDETKPPDPGPCDAVQLDYKVAFDALWSAGVIVVAASGNGGCTGGIASPACISTALSVGAVYDADLGFKAFGAGQCTRFGCSDAKTGADVVECFTDSGDRLDVFAPSHNATTAAKGGGLLTSFGGTSAAAPYVSGVAALLAQAVPSATLAELKAALRETGKPIADTRNGIVRNRVDALAALGALRSLAGPGPVSETLLVPIVLDVEGAGGSRYTTELTLVNRGTTPATVTLRYNAASRALPAAAGSGSAVLRLAPGEQRTLPDAIAWLRTPGGLAIPQSGGQGGTLRVAFDGLSAAGVAAVTARTTSPSCSGRAGLSYAGLGAAELATGPVLLFGLRETAADRTNLAVVNAGESGALSLRVTLRSGEPGDGRTYLVPEGLTADLAPGEWRQVGSADLLKAAGFASAVATVERTSGTAPFVAYAVVNDNGSNDGSYVPGVASLRAAGPVVVPVVVQAGVYRSELVLANPTGAPVTAALSYVESLAAPAGPKGTATEALGPWEQRVVPDAVGWLRDAKGLAIAATPTTSAGTLKVAFTGPQGEAVAPLAGARTGAAAAADCPDGGSYGLFTPALPLSAGAREEAWLVSLAQNATTRANLALLSLGDPGAPLSVRYELVDGASGRAVVQSGPIPLEPLGWMQVDGVLRSPGLSTAFVRVVRVSGTAPFAAYAVLNDGAAPGERTGDGSYVAMTAAR